jgi:hypothetical protein
MIISDLADAFERHFKLDSATLTSVSLNGSDLEWAKFGFVSLVSGRSHGVTVKLDGQSYNEAGQTAANAAMHWLIDHHSEVMV